MNPVVVAGSKAPVTLQLLCDCLGQLALQHAFQPAVKRSLLPELECQGTSTMNCIDVRQPPGLLAA